MFNALRKQFILTTMSIVSLVLVISFVAIYISTSNNLRREVGPPDSRPTSLRIERFDTETREFIRAERKDFVDKSMRELLVTLLVAGSVTLIAVYFISRYMADRAVGTIESAYDKQRQFITDASHELKTPIAVISANADAAISDQRTPSKWISNIKNESNRMGLLVNDLLVLAKLDDGKLQISSTKFDISDAAEDVANSFELLMHEKNIQLVRKLKKPLRVQTDSDKVKQILTILVDNAVKYSEPGNDIMISTKSSDLGVTVSVENTHPHITTAEIEKFFDRFYQADMSRSDKGHGLGLAIAKDIVQQLDASLHATSIKNRVIFTLGLDTAGEVR